MAPSVIIDHIFAYSGTVFVIKISLFNPETKRHYDPWNNKPISVSWLNPYFILKRCTIPVNTKHLYNIFTMLVQCRRRLTSVVQMLYKCFVFAGI